MKPATLIEVLKGHVKLIDTPTAAKLMSNSKGELGISLRRFHQLRLAEDTPPPTICHGRIVRYLDSDFDL